MQIIEITRGNLKPIFRYWRAIGKDIPYFFKATYQAFERSIFDDSHDGMTIFRDSKLFAAFEDSELKGFIQYGLPNFHYSQAGKITEGVDIGVVRNLYYDRERPDIGRALLDLAFDYFKENSLKDIYAFYHAMGMSANGGHGKLHESFSYIGDLLFDVGFELEHENIYYICDMKERRIESPPNTYIKVERLDDSQQIFTLFDRDNNKLGNAQIKYIDRLIGSEQRDTVYLVWIGIDSKSRGQGLGTEFLDHICDYFLSKGYRYLHTDTAIDNRPAQSFYLKNQFVDCGITRSYIKKAKS